MSLNPSFDDPRVQGRQQQRAASALGAVLSGANTLSVADTVATVRKGTVSRAGFALVVGAIATVVLPWYAGLGWALIMCAWEWLRPFLEDATALPAARRSQQAGFNWLALINFIGGLGYTSFPVIAWWTNEPLGMVIAAAWICGCATHLFVYFSSNRLLLLVTAGPLFLVALLVPFLSGGLSLASAAGAATLVALVAAASLFAYDRNVLLAILAKQAGARMAAEQANLAKSRFLATMSHELRTPLNSVIGYAELIEEEVEGGALAEDARKIRASARQLLGVIDVILDISRLESGGIALERDHIEIAAVLEQVREAALPVAAINGNSFTITEQGPLGEADIDHARLYQCLMQLVSNAAKFTKQGEIELRAARRSRNGRDSLVFEVADTGIGIPSEQREHIFEPFTQLEADAARRYEGSGLGLSLVQRLASLMDGDVTCDSEPGKGSTFTLWIAAGEA